MSDIIVVGVGGRAGFLCNGWLGHCLSEIGTFELISEIWERLGHAEIGASVA